MENVTMVERIKNLMYDKNISQVELAKLCKTTQSSLSPAQFKSIFSMQSDWLHTLAAKKDSSLAFACSITFTDFELCRHFFQIKSRKKSKKEIKKEATPIFGAASCGKLCMCTQNRQIGYIYLRFPNL